MAIITIGGNLGAGKTTLAEKLAGEFGYKEYHTGRIFRDIAREKGLSIETFYAALRSDPEFEKSVDERQATLMRTEDNIVAQGRVAWFFAKESSFAVFNIMLTVDPRTGAARSKRRPENAERSTTEIMRLNAEREHAERERYRALYGIENFLDPGHYDFVLDTTSLDEQEVFEKTVATIKLHLEADV